MKWRIIWERHRKANFTVKNFCENWLGVLLVKDYQKNNRDKDLIKYFSGRFSNSSIISSKNREFFAISEPVNI